MTTAPVAVGIRGLARALPLAERRRRMATVRHAPAVDILRAVLAVAIGAGEWRSASHAAEDVFVVEPREFRRWLDGSREIPAAARRKLVKLAWAFGVEVVAR